MPRLRLPCILTALCAATTLPAQLARDTVRLPAEVVTASRDASASRAATATATVLDGARLRAEGVRHLADALRRVPGLTVVRTSSFGSPTSLFLRGGQSNYVRVLIDGVPLNEPGGVVDLGRIMLDDVDRIEVLRGPASVLYGSEAVTGVVQLFTRRGGGRVTPELEAGAGSHGGRRAAVGLAGASAMLRGGIHASHDASDGFLPFNNGFRSDAVSAQAGLALAARTDVRVTGRYGASQYRYPTGSGGALEDRNAERTEHRVVAGLEVDHRWSERSSTRLLVSSSELWPRTSDGPDDAADTAGFYGFRARGVVVRRGVDLAQTARVGTTSLTAGAEWTRETERSASVSLSEFGEFPDAFRAARETRALYGQALGELGGLVYSVGTRLDDNSAFGTFRTARLGVARHIAPATRLRTSVGTAFKAPSFFENFASGFTIGNEALRPERAMSADVGLEHVVGAVGLVRVTAFGQRFRDLIQYTGAPPGVGEPNFHNVAAADAGGVEVEFSLAAARRFRADLAYTWTHTRVVDAGFDEGSSANLVEGRRLIRRPEHLATIVVTRDVGARGSVAAVVTYVGAREDRDFATWPATPVTMPDYATLDLSASLEPALLAAGALRLQLRVENATDAPIRQIAGFASPGRTLHAGLSLRR